MSMCSIRTGHACMQARQVVHDQISSGERTSKAKSGTTPFPVFLSRTAAEGTRLQYVSRNIWSRVLRTTSRGESGISAANAGHSSWQRPHLVQASEERSCFHEK